MYQFDNYIIENATIVLPDKVVTHGNIWINYGVIKEISSNFISGNIPRYQANEEYLLPGFIDLHSDAIEKEIDPRPNTNFPYDMSLLEMDKKLAANGITTIFHGVAFAESDFIFRSNQNALDLTYSIKQVKPLLNVRTYVHCRFEITNLKAVDMIENLLNEQNINLLSFMDHTPGQGQYKDVTSWVVESPMAGRGQISLPNVDELNRLLQQRTMVQDEVAEKVDHLIQVCHQNNVIIASHDDDQTERIEWLSKNLISIAEFPMNMDTIQKAKEMNIFTCIGAPNVFRGKSRNGNLNGREAIKNGYGDILCSDYAPSTLLYSVFFLHENQIVSLVDAVKMVTLNPAKAVGLNDTIGSIEIGKKADFVLINTEQSIPRIHKTFVRGKEIFSTCIK